MKASKRALVITNHNSSSGRADVSAQLDRLREAGYALDILSPENPADIPEHIRTRAPEADIIILGGGDGTLNTAAGALLQAGKPLGVLPLGTANDLCASLGIGNSVEKAMDAILNGRSVSIHVGQVNEAYFISVAHVGMSAEMVKRITREHKKRFGYLAYLLQMVRTFFAIKPFTARITCDGQVHETRAINVAIGNGEKYGSVLTFAEDASLTRDHLCCYVIQPQSLLQLALKLPAFYSGSLEREDNILFTRGERIRIETGKNHDIMADGEIVSRSPGEFSLIRNALAVFAPADYAATETERV